MKKVILFSLMLVSFVGYSQVPTIEDLEDGEVVIDSYTPHEQRDEERDENYIYTVVEVMPQYPGGMQEFGKFIVENFDTSNLPEEFKGKAIAMFVVEKDGSLSDIQIVRDLGYGTGKEAIRVLRLTEKWKPGLQNGKPVRVRYTLPINVIKTKSQE